MEESVFIVSLPGRIGVENVIVPAGNQEDAASYSSHILGGNTKDYVIDLITKHSSKTIMVTREMRER